MKTAPDCLLLLFVLVLVLLYDVKYKRVDEEVADVIP